MKFLERTKRKKAEARKRRRKEGKKVLKPNN